MKELTYVQSVERSIFKTYRKEIWNPFVRAIKQYALIREGDKIAVCISGGKDSMLLAKLMQLLHRITEVPFELVFLAMDPGYNAANRAKLEANAEKLEIPIEIFETDIFDVANAQTQSPCYLCARMRRGHLYSKAQSLGCNKIALGHHFNDVIETTLLGMFYGSQIQGMMPKLHSKNFPGMELIRPLYRVREDDIIAWKDRNGLDFLQCACRFTEKNGDGTGESKRLEIKLLLKELRKTNPFVEQSVFNSIHAVSLDTLIGYKYRGQAHSFLDNYDDLSFSAQSEE